MFRWNFARFLQLFGRCDVLRLLEASRIPFAMESLKLWIALSPGQLAELDKGNEVLPDEFSGRFGLRTCPAAAVDGAST